MIVGLCGPAGCGKNSVAEILRTKHGWIEFGFADPVYAAVASILRVDVAWLRDRGNKEKPIDWLGKSPRELLQTLGTEWGRNTIRDDIWVQIAMRQAQAALKYLRGAGGVAITDVRFANEAAAIHEAGGVIWRVSRRQSCLTDAAASHSSEAGIPADMIDDVLDNNGSLTALRSTVDAALKRLRKNIM